METLEVMFLGTRETFKYIHQRVATDEDVIKTVSDDAIKLDNLRHAFWVLRFSESEQESIFRVLSGILHLGNIQFSGEYLLSSFVLLSYRTQYIRRIKFCI